ncbi:putative carbohydrate binding protein [Sanguibacter keddieii DSM 10542]|uniref:Carbohydrate binding protein n=2 Tax=Sanguibacter keddieii TaxID=60920 RepID=D1BKC8_SANKS|nr:putative carbohydrate binding protein [Sanguibacter keddieii DSM 10542]
MLTSLALVGVVAVGAAAPPSTASPARADQSLYVPAASAVAVAEGTDEGQGGSADLLAVVDVAVPRGVTPVAVDKAPTVLPPDPTQPYPAWDAWADYAAGDRVVHDGLVYEAVVAHRGSGDPGLIKDRAVWRIVSVV